MKKAVILIIIFGIFLGARNYLQNSHNRAIMKNTYGVSDPALAGYISAWDNDYIYLLDENNLEKKIKIDQETKYIRTYIDEGEKLLQQEKISLSDFVKDQYVKIDIYRGVTSEAPRALIVRQLIYVDNE